MNEAKGLFKCLTLPTLKGQLTLTFMKGTPGGRPLSVCLGEAQRQLWGYGSEEHHSKEY